MKKIIAELIINSFQIFGRAGAQSLKQERAADTRRHKVAADDRAGPGIYCI